MPIGPIVPRGPGIGSNTSPSYSARELAGYFRPVGTKTSNRHTSLRANATRPIAVGYHVVAFQVRAEKDGVRPTLFSPYFFRLHDCANHGYSPYTTSSVTTSFNFGIYWFRGHDEGTVYFEIPERAIPCDLIYHAGLGEVHFNFVR